MNKVMIGDELSHGWELYKKNFGLLFGGSIITIFLSGAACGILTGPLTIGLFLLIDALANNGSEKPTVGVVFRGFDKFGAAFGAWFVMTLLTFVLSSLAGLIPIIGILLSVFVSMIGGCANLLALLFVSRKGMKGMEAVKAVMVGTFNGTYMNFLLACAVFSLVGASGVILCGLGVIFTVPIYYAAAYFAYRRAFGDGVADAAAELQAPTPAA